MAASQVVKIALQADVGGFIKDFSSADTAVGKFGATLQGIGRIGGAAASAIDAVATKAQQYAKHVSYAGVASTTFFTGLGVMAAKVETPLRNVQTLMGEGFGAKQFNDMRQAVLSMSTQFPQSATTLANGLYNIASSGFYGSDALKVLHASAMAASAGLTTTDNAAQSITAILNAYGLSANKAGDVSDALFQTVNLGVVTFEQLTGVIGDSVGMAANAGVSYSALGAAIATMTLSGLSAEESGTSLNRLLQSLIDPSDELNAAIHALGYESGTQALQVDGLRGVMDKLRVASQGNIATLVQWFPEIRAARGAMALMSADGQNYARVAAEIENKQNRAGATQRAFNIQMESASASFQKFMNSLQALGISIGTYFLPAAKIILDFATGVVGALDAIPGPIKAVIGWAGMLSSVLLAVGAAFLAWRLKTAVANAGLQLVGSTLQWVGGHVGTAGERFTTLGDRIKGIQGPFGVSRAAFQASTGVLSFFGDRAASAGLQLSVMSEKMTHGSSVVGFFGNTLMKAENAGRLITGTMGKVGSAIASMAGAIPFAIAAFVGLYSAWTNGKNKAEDFANAVSKGVDPKSPESLVMGINKLRGEYGKLVNDINQAKSSPGSFFQQWATNIADFTTNLVGVDYETDSTWDKLFKADKLNQKQRELVTTLHNIQKNATEVYSTLHPETAPGTGKLLGIGSTDLAYISTAAKAMGIDITKGFDKSAPQRQALLEDIKKMSGYFKSVGIAQGDVTESMIKQYQATQEAGAKAAKGAGDAFMKSFDLFKAIDPDKGDIGGQVTKFYAGMIFQANNFYNNLQRLQERGASPEVIQKMLQAGPEAAGAVVQAAVDDTTGGVIDVLNKGEEALKGFSERAASYARITQAAISSPTDQKLKDMSKAMSIQDQIFQQGGKATVQSVAGALGLDPDTARTIAAEFGITLREELDPSKIFKGTELKGMGPFLGADVEKSTIAKQLTDMASAMIIFNKTDPDKAVGIVQQLDKVMGMPSGTPEQNAKRYQQLQSLGKLVNQLPEGQRDFVYRIIGAELAQQKMRDVLDVWTPGGKPFTSFQKDFLIRVSGQEDAVKQINDFVAFFHETPSTWATLLEVVGTPEALRQAELVRSAISILQGKQLPVTVENVQALIATGEAQKHIDDTKQKNVPDVNVNTGNAKSDLDALQGKIDGMHGRDVWINIASNVDSAVKGIGDAIAKAGGKLASADGNIIRAFGDGGHQAMLGRGHVTRVWNEPETGGEAYIPLARSKRKRSLGLWAQTGRLLGAFADGGVQFFAEGGTTTQDAISAASNKQNLENVMTFWSRFSASGANAMAMAAAWGQDQEAAARHVAEQWTAVNLAAGKAAADQLLQSGLIGKAFDEAAAGIIENAQKVKAAAQDMFNSFSQPIKNLANLTSAFGKGSGVTAANIQDYFNQMRQGAAEQQSLAKQLAAGGLNQDTIAQMLQAGPDSLELMRAMASGGKELINTVNSSVTSLYNTANETGSMFTNIFNPQYAGQYDTIKAPAGYAAPAGWTAPPSYSVGSVTINIQGKSELITKTDVTNAITDAFATVTQQVAAG